MLTSTTTPTDSNGPLFSEVVTIDDTPNSRKLFKLALNGDEKACEAAAEALGPNLLTIVLRKLERDPRFQ